MGPVTAEVVSTFSMAKGRYVSRPGSRVDVEWMADESSNAIVQYFM